MIHEAELHRDLEIEGDQPELEDFGDLIEHVDGYLCEIKDLQVRDGLHILGQVPQGEQLRGLLNAILRLQGFADAEPDYDRQLEILGAFLADGTKTGDPAIDTVLELAEHEVLPKLLATADEIPALIGGLHGRHVVAGRPAPPRAGASTSSPPAATCTASTRARCRPTSPTRPARSSPTRCSPPTTSSRRRSASSSGARPRCAPPATTRARSSRCSACGPSGIPRRAGSSAWT